jgi:ankyrin repeat protein
VVKLLLETRKVNVNSKDSENMTLFSYAARYGYEAVLKLFLEAGQAKINSRDNMGRTPLSWATALGHVGVVKLLLETGQVELKRPFGADAIIVGCTGWA